MEPKYIRFWGLAEGLKVAILLAIYAELKATRLLFPKEDIIRTCLSGDLPERIRDLGKLQLGFCLSSS